MMELKKDLNMENIIYLDIDGVLAPKRMFAPYGFDPELKARLVRSKNDPTIGKLPDTLVHQVYHHFDSQSCQYIRELAQEFNAKIVITSSWRLFYNLEQMKAILNIFDLGPYVADLTLEGLPRYRVIQDHIKSHNVKRYLVIDDLNMERQFPNHFVLANYRFDQDHYKQARKLLLWQN